MAGGNPLPQGEREAGWKLPPQNTVKQFAQFSNIPPFHYSIIPSLEQDRYSLTISINSTS
jgi:hypothetical protein